MSLGQVTSSLRQGLVGSLDFSLPQSADYILQRNSVQLLPTAGDSWASDAQRTIEFRLAGSDFLDVSTLVFSCDFINTGDAAIQPTTPLHGIFSRATTTIAGQVCENIDHYNRVAELVYRLMSPEAKMKSPSCLYVPSLFWPDLLYASWIWLMQVFAASQDSSVSSESLHHVLDPSLESLFFDTNWSPSSQ